tara:strand:+ start:2632 stop:3903 length:1272 start_codon:yes stop_codon:yes gene_type:complete
VTSTNLEPKYLNWLAELDGRIVTASRDIKVLSKLSWGAGIQERFLESVAKGKPELPRPEYASINLSANRHELAECMAQLARSDEPLRKYLFDTAESYHTLCLLLESIGTAELSEHSHTLYGHPTDAVSSGHVNNLEAAQHFLEVSHSYKQDEDLKEADYCLSAETLAEEMRLRLSEVFDEGQVRVEIDEDMVSKAAAGATRVRLRANTSFTEYDLDQLLQHEAFVHSLTAINGKQQRFQCFSLGAPRTTGSQEGLATFAEMVTGVMDIGRLERLALRVVGIDHVLKGADFIESFRFFESVGQTEVESFNSAMRIFRGVPVTGGSAFTKDVVYLHGLMEVHTFFRWAMQHKKLAMTQHFFAGRMTLSDVVNLEEVFGSDVLQEPKYLPRWMTRTSALAGYLAFSVFVNRISVETLGEDFTFLKQ